MDEGVE